MSLTLYGIPNCDTVRKTRRWLDEQKIAYTFHDFRADGVERDRLVDWIDRLDWTTVINRRSTSWKALSPEAREGMNADRALEAALAAPTLIKRPVIEGPAILEVGFSAERYAALFG